MSNATEGTVSGALNSEAKAYLVGGGIASLAAASFLVRDAGFPGKNIHILEQERVTGGALDASGAPDIGYISRGGRMFEKHYACMFDLFSSIPSIEDENVSVKDEVFAFNQEVVSDARCRLLKACERLDVSSYGLSLRHKTAMLRLLLSLSANIE